MEILKITIFACLAVAAFLPCGVKAQDCSAIADLTDVQMFVLGNQLVVVWQEPSNLITCGFENIQHTVTYTGYQSEQDTTTPDYYVYFDYYPYSCVPSIVTITTSSGDLSTSTTVEYYTETSKVDNLAVSKVESGTLVASWSKPADSEYCDFVYLVTYQDENSNPLSIETTDLETDLGVSITSCALATITVTPINRQYAGIAVTTGYEGDINPVRNYGLEMVAAEVIAQFDPPLDIENCDITYEVREVEDDCYTKNVSVAAFNGRIYSPWTTDSIETEIASLADVSASVNSNVIEMSWTAPLDAETCSITYQVEFDGTTYTTSESNLAFEVEALDACGSMTISVSAVSSTGKVGVASDVAVQGQLAAIQNLVMESLQEGGALVATWDAPENSSSCTLSYLLEYTNETGSHIYVTTDNTYTFAYEACIEVTLSVTPHSEDGSEGPKATVTLTAYCI